MNRVEFMQQLERQLDRLSPQEREDALAFYNEYFDEAGVENEAEAIRKLGSPVKVAAQIKADYAVGEIQQSETPSVKKGVSAIWLVLLGIFALPIALPLAIAAVAVVIALLTAAVSVVAALVIAVIAVLGSGILCGVVGVSILFQNAVTGVLYIGIGLVAIGLSLLLGILVFLTARAIFSGIARLLNRVRIRGQEKHQAAAERNPGPEPGSNVYRQKGENRHE